MLHEIHHATLPPHLHMMAGWYSNGPTLYKTREPDGQWEDADDESQRELAIADEHLPLSPPCQCHCNSRRCRRSCVSG
uniref:Uncharacterized protein n=1 Tax=Oryza sativa subsp. japonica TaxID=39947 RepID=Q6Z1N5_ORYSJ|nr:hypothetical protein [Oryza sativa Japonica Group]